VSQENAIELYEMHGPVVDGSIATGASTKWERKQTASLLLRQRVGGTLRPSRGDIPKFMFQYLH